MLWRSNPALKGYVEDKKLLTVEANKMFLDLAGKLPDWEGVTLRSDFEPETAQQKQLLEAFQPRQIPSWDEIKQVAGQDISPAMETLLAAYWQEGVPLSSPAQKQMDYLASRYGREFGVNDADSFLRLIGVAMSKPQQAQPVVQAPQAWVNPLAAQP